METYLIVSSVDSFGKKKQKSLPNIDPSATNAELSEFAQMINGLSTNTYVEATRVDKSNVAESPGPSPSSKEEPIFIIDDGYYEYNGDGQVFGYAYNGSTVLSVMVDRENKNWEISGDVGTVELYASEGEQYAAKMVSYTKGA